MKISLRSAAVLCAFVFLLLASGSAFATDVFVDCTGATPGAFTSINAAIASLDRTGPNSIGITGPCTENVVISQYERLFLYASTGSATISPTDPNRRPLVITGSQEITLEGLNFHGGRGVLVFDHSTSVSLFNCVIDNSSVAGINFTDSFSSAMSSCQVRNNARAGVAISGGSLTLDTMTIEGNTGSGVSVTTAKFDFFGGDGITPGTESYVRNNGNNGIGASNSATLGLSGDIRIQNNAHHGVLMIHTSTLIADTLTIEGNGNYGVHVGETSHGEFAGPMLIRNNGNNANAGATGGIEVVENSDLYLDGGVSITGNLGPGINVDMSSLLSSVGGDTINGNTQDGVRLHALSVAHLFAPDSITGNGVSNVSCDTTSLVTGDPTGLTNVSCKNVERKNGPPRGGHIQP